MKYRKLGSTGDEVYVLGFGCIRLPVVDSDHTRIDDDIAIPMLREAIDAGVNLIDTAPAYGWGRSEGIVGRAIKDRRDKVVLATKCGLIGKGANIKINLAPDSINREIDESLKRLDIDYIDIYQCHWPDPNTPIETTLETLCKLREKGKINAQVIMENLRQGTTIEFIPVEEKISILAGELKCKYKFLSTVDAVIIAEALTRNIFIYTTETHFKDVENLKVKKIDY